MSCSESFSFPYIKAILQVFHASRSRVSREWRLTQSVHMHLYAHAWQGMMIELAKTPGHGCIRLGVGLFPLEECRKPEAAMQWRIDVSVPSTLQHARLALTMPRLAPTKPDAVLPELLSAIDMCGIAEIGGVPVPLLLVAHTFQFGTIISASTPKILTFALKPSTL
jgi:hypothetical protein